jgi:hypothetical protein
MCRPGEAFCRRWPDLRQERPSVQGGDAQNLEEALRHAPDTKALGLVVNHELEAGWFDRGKRLERGTALSPVQEVCGRGGKTVSGSVGVLLPDRHDPVYPRKRKWIQQDRVDDAEHRGRGPIPIASVRMTTPANIGFLTAILPPYHAS